MAINIDDEQGMRDRRMLLSGADAEGLGETGTQKLTRKPLTLNREYSSEVGEDSLCKIRESDKIREHLSHRETRLIITSTDPKREENGALDPNGEGTEIAESECLPESIKEKPSTMTDEPAKTLNKYSLKRKQSFPLSTEDSPIALLAAEESNNRKTKKIKTIRTQVDRTIEREKVANSKGRGNSSSDRQRYTNTILSLLIDKDIVLPRTTISYRHEVDGRSLKEGWITCTGIDCTCCNKNYSVPDFESHAGVNTERPLESIYLKDGRSLSDCLVQVIERDRPGARLNTRFKMEELNLYDTDNLCSVCREGGFLVMCDYCTSTYHTSCLGITGEVDDDWSCPSCSCKYCGSSEFHPEANISSNETVVFCDQCENEYHIGCTGYKDRCHPTRSFCSRSCSKIWQRLDDLVGIKIPTSRDGYTWTLLKYAQYEGSQTDNLDHGSMAELNAKLCLASEVLSECFLPIVGPRNRNLISDMIFNQESKLKRLDFRGFYTIVLEKGDEVVSTATLRVHGENFAEVPLVGTRPQVRKQGLCKLLMSSLEQLIKYLEVKRLILPAAPQMFDMWTMSFGFNRIDQIELNNLLKYKLVKFSESLVCQKVM